MSYPITFGKYLLLERINVGGMAEVFKAKAFGVEGFERILAIKRILPNMAEDDEFINMFIDEARIAVQLNHANIVPIYELGKFESQYYIAMEFVPGRDLRQILDRFRKKKETMPIQSASYVVSKICEGLDYAHRKHDASGRPLHLIHRDVSPQNILVGYEGEVKITDFGIVKAEDRASKTQAGVLKGKFGYMSPEQVRGLEIDHRSDIFAVGILLYEALTGKRLFIGESDFATLEKVRAAEVVPPSQHNPNINEALDAVVLKALARERDERYQWAMELHDDLQQFLIEDQSIFNAKKLSTFLKEEYSEEIAADRAKMDQFMKLPPPTSVEALEGAQQMRQAPTGDWNDNRAEKTMIFESGFDSVANAQTLVGDQASAGLVPPPAPFDTAPSDLPPPPAPDKRRRKLLMAAAMLFLLLPLAALAFLLADMGGADGTLVVRSSPTDTVDVFMDGELIGQKTPLVRQNVPVGEHTLLARAPGFGDKAYRFDLVAGAPAEIKIELQTNGTAVPAGEVQVQINSDPPVAAVRLGGVPQSTTPYTMTVRDITHPLVLEVVKTGYITQSVVVNFNTGDKRKVVQVKLVPVGNEKPGLPPGVSPGKLKIASNPSGATIFLGGQEKGVTPKDIGELDPRQTYALELSLDGYKSHEETIKFGNKNEVAVRAKLVKEAHKKPHPQGGGGGGGGRSVAERPEPHTQSGGGGGGGGSGCTGSGGKISVMPVGIGDCKVTVGRLSLGVAPVFKKDSPTGKCPVDVRCPGGKHYTVTRMIRAGNEEKIIIKPEEWQQ